ncbi:MAG: CBS domain-containing protein [Bacillota bacterium]
MKVKDIMTRNVLTVEKDISLARAVKIMIDNRISGLPVVDSEYRVIGMITKSDIVQVSLPSALRRTGGVEPSLVPPVEIYIGRLREVAGRSVENTMSRQKVISARPEMNISEVAVMMYGEDVRRLPVVDEGGYLLGIVSYSDIAAIIADD